MMTKVLTILAAISLGACANSAKKTEATASAQAAADVKAVNKEVTTTKTEGISAPAKVLCSVKGDERVLEVRTKGSGCELAYTKAGKEGVVASSNSSVTYCAKALEKIQEKLKGSGFACK